MIKSKRNLYLGAHLTREVKKKLLEDAQANDVTVSRRVYEILSLHYKIELIRERKRGKS